MKVIIVTKGIDGPGATSRSLRQVVEELRQSGVQVIVSPSWRDSLVELRTNIDVAAFVVDWEETSAVSADSNALLSSQDLKELLLESGADMNEHKVVSRSRIRRRKHGGGTGAHGQQCPVPSSRPTTPVPVAENAPMAVPPLSPVGVVLNPPAPAGTSVSPAPAAAAGGLTTAKGRALKELERRGFNVVVKRTDESISEVLASRLPSLDAPEALIKFLKNHGARLIPSPLFLLQRVRERSPKLPVFMYSSSEVIRMPLEVLELIKGFIGKAEDTPGFLAKRIHHAATEYVESLLPPFFSGLLKYADSSRYAFHTPGHAGGVAFLRSPVGKLFLDFYGENSFRADLSVSVPELGSLLDHSSVLGQSEAYAARVFGAEQTFFVTNGTSTSNRVVYQSCCVPGDIVLLDRNSHKSSIQSIQLSNALPVYLRPVRNSHGILGPVPLSEFDPADVDRKIRELRAQFPTKVRPDDQSIRLAVLTNCTYDGICYRIPQVLSALAALDKAGHPVRNLLCDEAWYAYAHFNPLYSEFHAMSTQPCLQSPHPKGAVPTSQPAIFATQSTHKVLAAFSQASMIHVRQVADRPHFKAEFNNSFMMSTSTSPQYSIIASLDVASAMMDQGPEILKDTIKEAVAFRKKMAMLSQEHEARGECWFPLWQPPEILLGDPKDPRMWILPESGPSAWHGFPSITKNSYMLDPLKVTIITRHNLVTTRARQPSVASVTPPPADPGAGSSGQTGLPLSRTLCVPAPVMAKFLQHKGLVVEKQDFFTVLVLFTIGITRGKSASLLVELHTLKRAYTANIPVMQCFPELVGKSPLYTPTLGLQDLCEKMTPLMLAAEALETQAVSCMPRCVMTPGDAYQRFVTRDVEWVRVHDLEGRVSSVLIVPYPPGIPLICPGEVFGSVHVALLRTYIDLWDAFPGFESEVHGMVLERDSWVVACVK